MKRIAFFTDTHLGQEVYLTNDYLGSEKMNYREEPDVHKENLTAALKDIVERGITEVAFGGDTGSKKKQIRTFLTPFVCMVSNPELFLVIMILFQKFQNILFLILHQMHR